MGHYLSDVLPDPKVICLACQKGGYAEETIKAWNGLLNSRACDCKPKDQDWCPIGKIKFDGRRWVRKKKKK